MYKIIACDLDETILNRKHELAEGNLEAIEWMIKNGVRFIPATGRGFLFIDSILKEVGLWQKENEYSISYNGAVITENKNHKIIYFNGFTYEEAVQIFGVVKKENVSVSVATLDAFYNYNLNDDERARYATQNIIPNEIEGDTIEFLKEARFPKILVQDLNMAYLREIAEKLRDVFGEQLSISYSSNRYLEINKAGVDKGSALLYLADMLGIQSDEIIAIGDNHNDFKMLQVAGFAAAPRNAVTEVKEICDYIGENDHDEGILKEIREKIF